jgi:sarcosine oxidase
MIVAPASPVYRAAVSRLFTEVAIVGGGITGLSTGYALQRRGVECVCFEAAAPGTGQSAGRTRVFRHGHDDERLVRLAVRARAEWERLEGELGTRLLGREGVLVCGPQVAERAAAFETAGVAARRVGRDEQASVLPVLAPPGDEALCDELGGSIDVRTVIDGLAAALDYRLVRARVFAVREGASGIELHTSEGLWSAGRAVLCPGAQLHELTPGLGLEIPLTVELHTRAPFRVREPGARLACLQDRSGVHGETVYAAPMPDGREYAIGLGGELEPPVDEALARLKGYVERGMPGLDPEPASVRLCQTSVLPWGGDAFAVWDTGRVAVLAGANLFKFGPLLGELIAEGTVDELSPAAQLGREVNQAAGQARPSG